MFLLCFCYTMSSIPHAIYGYWATQYDKEADQLYRISLGVFWLQYAFNVWIYVAQRDQYWNAYKDYICEKLFRTNTHKLNPGEKNENKFDVTSTSEKQNNLNVDRQADVSQSGESSLNTKI